jgi:hypothetical protein
MEYVLEITQEYKYLGVLFKPSGSFSKANEYLCKKARKALFCIYKAVYSDKLSILPNLKLLDSCVKPMLLYCSTILCLDTLLKDNITMESRYFLFQPVKVQIKFAKHILGVNKTATNLTVLGELDMIPCSVDAIKLCVGFWHHVVNSNPDSLINKMYLSSVNNNSVWYRIKMKLLFDNSFCKNRLTYAIYKKLRNDFIKFWEESI